jgi:hypothetical protein
MLHRNEEIRKPVCCTGMKRYGSQWEKEWRDTEASMGHWNKEILKPVWGTEMKRYGSRYVAPKWRNTEASMLHRNEEIRKPVGKGLERYGSQYGALE